MELTHIIAFNIALLAALVSPGPGMLIAWRSTRASGRRAGLLTGVGLGLDVIFAAVSWAYLTLKLIGALGLRLMPDR